MVRTIHQSGAIEEIAQAIQEASIATCDTAREISNTAKDLRDRDIIRRTTTAAEETKMVARQTTDLLKENARETDEAVSKSERQ
jgi:CTP-dependent riboflavin kinase